ncbi:hypothetical protein EGR_07525 [Echinococcus granulosus]|uniref:Uncharacterized protein n=1 Tax=Echinococcus granulosus TaxID=6210 RepID=W6UW01_ECHGR|nr:hypothetical protein EGR_07525 [Echinococcus granulosus]EUB57649.1 hypothetical protein EGR_07525 [Echinococcus granulosus]
MELCDVRNWILHSFNTKHGIGQAICLVAIFQSNTSILAANFHSSVCAYHRQLFVVKSINSSSSCAYTHTCMTDAFAKSPDSIVPPPHHTPTHTHTHTHTFIWTLKRLFYCHFIMQDKISRIDGTFKLVRLSLYGRLSKQICYFPEFWHGALPPLLCLHPMGTAASFNFMSCKAQQTLGFQSCLV